MINPSSPPETRIRGRAALSDLRPGQSGRVYQAPDLPLLAALGVRPGKQLHYIARSLWRGPLVCRIEERTFVIAAELAASILLDLTDAS